MLCALWLCRLLHTACWRSGLCWGHCGPFHPSVGRYFINYILCVWMHVCIYYHTYFSQWRQKWWIVWLALRLSTVCCSRLFPSQSGYCLKKSTTVIIFGTNQSLCTGFLFKGNKIFGCGKSKVRKNWVKHEHNDICWPHISTNMFNSLISCSAI